MPTIKISKSITPYNGDVIINPQGAAFDIKIENEVFNKPHFINGVSFTQYNSSVWNNGGANINQYQENNLYLFAAIIKNNSKPGAKKISFENNTEYQTNYGFIPNLDIAPGPEQYMVVTETNIKLS